MLNGLVTDLDRSGLELVVDEKFDGDDLNQDLWLPYHLPHWSSRDRSAAHYRIADDGLELLIDRDQRPWYPDGDGFTRLSTVQTGVFAGPVGSTVGQHRFKPQLVVREEQTNVALFTQRYGLFECHCSVIGDEPNMAAFWLIGYEDEPQRSAEICVMEIFGRHVGADSTRVGLGVHPHNDPNIVDDFSREPVSIDAREPHTYSARWTPNDVSFYVDGVLAKVVEQSPDYPMQLMLSAFEFVDEDKPGSPPETYPKVFHVEWVRVWR